MTEPRKPYYDHLDFNSPMTGQTADGLVAELAAAQPRGILDVGCGWAELLLRLLAAVPGAEGMGVDHDPSLLDRARRNAEVRGLASRVRFAAELGEDASADLVVNVGAEHVFGDLDQALDQLWPLVEPEGRLLFGTLFWEQPPSPDLVADFGELPTLVELTDRAVVIGWRPLALTVASVMDWDRFEFGFIGDWEQTVMAAEDLDQRDQARRKADEYRAAYFGRRGVLGFAYLTLGRPQIYESQDT